MEVVEVMEVEFDCYQHFEDYLDSKDNIDKKSFDFDFDSDFGFDFVANYSSYFVVAELLS